MMKLKALFLILFFLSPAVALSQTEEPIEVLLFFSPHCYYCRVVEEEVIPVVEEKYKEKIRIEELDIDKPDNYLKLIELQEKYNWYPKQISTPTLFIDGKFLVGSTEIKRYLEIYIDTALSRKGYAPF